MEHTITYLTGDATSPQASGPKIIAHVCNDIGRWGAGFVVAISKRWTEPETQFRDWYADRKNNDFALGAVQFVSVRPDITVANLVGQRGIKGGRTKNPPIRYEAIGQGLATIAAKAKELGASVHMPRIGCGLAGGKWELVEPLIIETLGVAGVPVFVYDFKK